jgi:DNA-binding NarL/FixJ family response regulator
VRAVSQVLVMIVDDHAVVRRGVRAYLEARDDMAVAAEAADGQDALDQLAKMAVHATLPDVVLLDLVMPRMDGVAAASLITSRHPAVRVVILTSFGEMERVHAALAGGAVGYLLNSFVGSHLLVESIYRTEHRRRRLTAMSLQEVRHHG